MDFPLLLLAVYARMKQNKPGYVINIIIITHTQCQTSKKLRERGGIFSLAGKFSNPLMTDVTCWSEELNKLCINVCT